MVVAAIDPGREKCGIAVLAGVDQVLDQAVVPTVWLEDELSARVRKYEPELILLGNGTTSKAAEEVVREAAPDVPLEIVNEFRTTDDAKRAYWKANPPTGWRRFFPTSMQVPPVPVDDFVAVLLAQRYLINKK